MRLAIWFVPQRGLVVLCSCGMSVRAGMRSLLRLGKVLTTRRDRWTIRLLWGRAVARRRMGADLGESSRRYLGLLGSPQQYLAPQQRKMRQRTRPRPEERSSVVRMSRAAAARPAGREEGYSASDEGVGVDQLAPVGGGYVRFAGDMIA